MVLRDYPLKDAINDISKIYGLDLKDAWDMNLEELMAAEKQIMQYVEFTLDRRFCGGIPKDKKTGQLIVDMKWQNVKLHTSFYVPKRTPGASEQTQHQCNNCGHIIDLADNTTDPGEYHTCPICKCHMISDVNKIFKNLGLYVDDPGTEYVIKATEIMLKNETNLKAIKIISETVSDHYYHKDTDNKGEFRLNEQKQ